MSIPDSRRTPVGLPLGVALLLFVVSASAAAAQSSAPILPAAACAYTLAPATAAVAVGGASGNVTVTTAVGCAWTSSSNAPWVTITSDAGPRTGPGIVSYTADGNSGLLVRSGALMIANKSFTLTQPGCTYTLPATPSPVVGMNGGAGSVVLTTAGTCLWTNTSGATWVTITSGTDRIGAGTVTFTVDGNTGPLARSATLTIGGKPYKVNQAACTYALDNLAGLSFPPIGGDGAVGVATGDACGWTNTSPVPWATITSGSPRTGSGQVSFTVPPNAIGVARTTSLTVAGKPFKVGQAPCMYALNAAAATLGMNGGDGSVTVTTSDGCPWTTTVPSTVTWITLTSPTPQTGSGSASYTGAPNNTLLTRSATLTIGGKPHKVTQSPCTFTLDPTMTSLPPAGGAGTFSLTTGDACPWTSTLPVSVTWVTITSEAARTASGPVSFTVAPNTGAAPRTATITAGGKPFKITQANCTYTLSAAVPTFGMNGGDGGVTVTTFDGCPWSSTSPVPWLTINSPSPQTGSGAVSYMVAGNTGGTVRTAMLKIAGKTYTVGQAACTWALDSPNAAYPPAGGTGGVGVTTGDACGWTNKSSTTWATITSGDARTGPGAMAYTVVSNTTAAARTATLTIGGKIHAVTQANCTYALAAASASFAPLGGTNSVGVTTFDGCPWTTTVPAAATWITLTSPSPRIGSGAVSYTVALNTTGVKRIATLTIAGKPHVVSQETCAYAVTPTSAPQPRAGGPGSVTVTTADGCPWTSSSNMPWVTLATPSPQTGAGPANYTVASNTGGTPRTATLTVAGKSVMVTQPGCTYALGAANASFTVEGGDGSVAVTTEADCAWTSKSNVAWVTINSAESRTGNGTVSFTVMPNPTAAARSTMLQIAGKTFTVSQSAAVSTADLRISLTPPSGGATTGKGVPAPSIVKNFGSKPSGPFDVGIFLSQINQPGSGMLLKTVHVPELGPGGILQLPDLEASLPNAIEPGQYFMSAVADIGSTVAQPPSGNHAAVVGPFKVGRGVGGIKDVSANVTLGQATTLPPLLGAPACTLFGSLSLSGSVAVLNQTVNEDNSVTATGTVTLADPARPATFSGGTFMAIVGTNDRATVTLSFTSVTLPGYSGPATATAMGSLKFSEGVGAAGSGSATGFAFESDVNGFTGTFGTSGCGFTGSLKATVDLIAQLFFFHFVDGGAFPFSGGLTPATKFPAPFYLYGTVLSTADRPGTLPSAGQVTFTGPSGSGLNGQSADPVSSVVDQADGFGGYMPPLVSSTTGAPDGTYTINYKGARQFNVDIDANVRAVIPFPTITLDAGRNLQKVTWVYRNRQTGAPIAPPPFIGLVSILIGIDNGGPLLDFCSSDFFDRTTLTFTVSSTPTCPTPVHWDNVFALDFIYIDSLTLNGYIIDFSGPVQAASILAVTKLGTGSGTVKSSPVGIDCGPLCTAAYATGATVTLTATPASGSKFIGWGGACSGTQTTCTLSMSTDRAVTATFNPPPPTSAKVRFLNDTIFNGAPWTATLRTAQGYSWSSSTSTFSSYQNVTVTTLSGFLITLPNGVTLSGSVPFSLTFGRSYTLVFTVENGGPTLILFDEGATSAARRAIPLRPGPKGFNLPAPFDLQGLERALDGGDHFR